MSRKSHIQIKIAECLRHTLAFFYININISENNIKKWVWHAAVVCANEHFNDHQYKLMGDSAIQIVTIAVVVYFKLVQWP